MSEELLVVFGFLPSETASSLNAAAAATVCPPTSPSLYNALHYTNVFFKPLLLFSCVDISSHFYSTHSHTPVVYLPFVFLFFLTRLSHLIPLLASCATICSPFENELYGATYNNIGKREKKNNATGKKKNEAHKGKRVQNGKRNEWKATIL